MSGTLIIELVRHKAVDADIDLNRMEGAASSSHFLVADELRKWTRPRDEQGE